MSIVDAPGAVVTTSTRPDNLAATLELRSSIGPVAIFDPQNLGRTEGIRWSPVRGCENPTTAMVRASGLAAGAGFTKGGVSDGAFWHGQTEMALRGLLHAAAIDDCGISQLYRWGLEPASAIEAVTILNRSADAADGWGDTLDGIVRMDGRTRDAIWPGSVRRCRRSPIPQYAKPSTRHQVRVSIPRASSPSAEPSTYLAPELAPARRRRSSQRSSKTSLRRLVSWRPATPVGGSNHRSRSCLMRSPTSVPCPPCLR